MTDTQLLCPFCNSELQEEMYNGMYGCDTGCDYVRFQLTCTTCKKLVYDTGDFGRFDDGVDPYYKGEQPYEEYRQEFLEEWAEAVAEINAKRNHGA